ncbi:uncharacterized protein LOC122055201 [Zingiber officinale]|uniref:uncharacterized protein LOC122055201 n=1 Tax=Zingiber officinale TaxID=94328 RepID=UPI001C4BB0DE|nr:uncharacterized protein LOC122055201 [Zingiber officinale]
MWIIIQTDLELPLDDAGKLVSCQNWDTTLIKKVEANVKATCTLQCGLTKEKMNRVGPFSNTKELWEKLIKLHEGTSDMKEGTSRMQESKAKRRIEPKSEDESDSEDDDDEITAELVKLV